MRYLIQWTDKKGHWQRKCESLIGTINDVRSIYLRKGDRRPQSSVIISRITK